MSPVAVVLFGLGKMGGFHLKTLMNDPRFEVVAVVDPEPKDAEVTRGVRQLTSVGELQGFAYDMAVIASATASHFTLAKSQLLAGKHLLVEKPLAPTPAEAEELVALAAERNLCLAVGHVERSNPAIILCQRLLATEVIGDVVHGISQRGGGYPASYANNDVLIDLAVHDLDVFSYLLGEQSFQSARCHAVSQPGIIDVAEVHTVRSGGLATSTAAVNWQSPHRVRELRLTGSEGVVEVDYLGQTVTVSGFHVQSRLEQADGALLAEGEVSTLANGCQQITFAAKKQDALAHQLDQFYRYLNGDTHRLCVGPRTADTLNICQLAKATFTGAAVPGVPAAAPRADQTPDLN